MLLYYFIFQAKKYIQSLPVMPKKDFGGVFKGANPLGSVLI
jgi:hypothetical protein